MLVTRAEKAITTCSLSVLSLALSNQIIASRRSIAAQASIRVSKFPANVASNPMAVIAVLPAQSDHFGDGASPFVICAASVRIAASRRVDSARAKGHEMPSMNKTGETGYSS